MPCLGPTPAEEAAMQRADNKKKYGVALSNFDLTTRVACLMSRMLTELDNLGEGDSLLPEEYELVEKWREEHRKLDMLRAEQEGRKLYNEYLKKKALSKLTDDEKKALGV